MFEKPDEQLEIACRALYDYMSYLSEEYWCAGWLIDWEYECWQMLVEGTFRPEESYTLNLLRHEVGGWMKYNCEFVDWDVWLADYEANKTPEPSTRGSEPSQPDNRES